MTLKKLAVCSDTNTDILDALTSLQNGLDQDPKSRTTNDDLHKSSNQGLASDGNLNDESTDNTIGSPKDGIDKDGLLKIDAANIKSSDDLDIGSSTNEIKDAVIDLDLGSLNHTLELELDMVADEDTYTLLMYTPKKISVNYTLYCVHPSVQYMLSGRIDNHKVSSWLFILLSKK